MADIRCSHCGNDNPDFFDVCQFCQSPLKSESMLHTGDVPSEKDTGELEPILPEWLQDVRQQSRESGDDDSFSPQTKPRTQSVEPIDLLAGLASQDDSDEDEVPDWLASINPIDDKKSNIPPSSEEKEVSSDFFAQFSKTESQPSKHGIEEPSQEDAASFMGKDEQTDAGQPDELAGWLSQTPKEAGEITAFESGGIDDENSWMKDLGSSESPTPEPPAEKEPEDLGWLHDLENSAKQTGEIESPQPATDFNFASTQKEFSDDDLSWLDNLGGTPTPSPAETSHSRPESSEDDLRWLDNLGGTPSPIEETPTTEPLFPQDDLSWLDNLGGIESQAAEEPAPEQSESSSGDLDWLSNLGGEQTVLKEESEPPSMSPPGTAPLGESAGRDSTPDWLKSALEEQSMPSQGDLSMDWITEQNKPVESEEAAETHELSDFKLDENSPSFESEPVTIHYGLDLPGEESSATSQQDIDSIFNIDIPDWASQESGDTDAGSFESPVSGDESLAPVELPSWVQAMRPVDSAITGTYADNEEQVTESEGPLAGFSGVIPSAPIGSSLRPKAFSMKLQVTDEQQSGASLIEQILAGETVTLPTRSTTAVTSQHMLRWILSALFILALGFVIVSGSQGFAIFPSGRVSELSNLVGSIPDGSPILFVVDYEPAVAGELTAAAGPVLDQLALARHSTFTFISMSPNGSAMVEHLISNTRVGGSAPDSLGYRAGEQYFNAGFLPGGSAGVLGFIREPGTVMPGLAVDEFGSFEAVVVLTDNAESGRVWIEQLTSAKQTRPEIASKPLIVVSSAQAGPMLEPYVLSGQVNVMINGLADGAEYEYVNQSRPGLARSYWDSFGMGLMIAVISIVLGGIWNVLMGIRERRAEEEPG